ncbi:hypothetical protein OS493_031038 [Desmophyllum pertusum]|uniref:Uncharacterized protein n=1 Tax=Desmophyllum pertusum TaxID=174260 RepID=A0A9W9YW78_9CNID|nr:hypothetical protein OS493_031038 [Desmophyllum pertusum]
MFTRTSSLLEVGFRKRQSLPGYEQVTCHGYKVLGVARARNRSLGGDGGSDFTNNGKMIQDAEALFGTMEEAKKIFLASDNDEIVGDLYRSHKSKQYHSNHPINGVFTNDTDPIEIGSQVLIDILLLAKCGHFLHAESSVATLVSFFNPEMKLSFLVTYTCPWMMVILNKKLSLAQVGILKPNWRRNGENRFRVLPRVFKLKVPPAHVQMRTGNRKDGDFNTKPFPDSSEESEIEWEEGWGDQIQSLAWCFKPMVLTAHVQTWPRDN